MPRYLLVCCCAAVVSACFTPTLEREPGDGEPLIVTEEGRHSCGSSGGACSQSSDCCVGSFCNNLTYAPWKCTAPEQSQSGVCHNGTCGAAVCGTSGTACATDGDCCGGTFCFNYTYAPAVCRAALADGATCMEDSQCVSGHCLGGSCSAANTCFSTGTVCSIDTDCCPGSYCFTPSPYLPDPSTCQAGAAAGTYCGASRQCASDSCVNHVCAQ